MRLCPRLPAVVLAALGSLGCDEDPAPILCGDGSERALEVRSAQDAVLVDDGATVPIFPPPQGGIFTELDLLITGVDSSANLGSITVLIEGSGEQLALQNYAAQGYPVSCEDATRLIVRDLPVGFRDDLVFQDLDGMDASLAVTVRTDADDLQHFAQVTLMYTDT